MKTIPIVLLFLAMTLAFSTSVYAKDNRNHEAQTDTTLSKLDTTDPDTFNCSSVSTDVQETICKGGLIPSNIDLVKDMNELTLVLSPEGQEVLKKSQLYWHAARNYTCELDAFGETGTKASTSYIACLADANKTRHDFLQDHILRHK